MTAIGIFIAIFLAFFIIRLLYWQPALEKLDVDVSISSTRAMEGAKLVLTTVLTNTKWLPLPWVSVKLRVSRHLLFSDTENAQITDHYYRNDLYNILMRQRITRRLPFVCGKRGYYRVDSVDVTAWDMLVEQKSSASVKCDVHLTVYPSGLPMENIDDICVQVYGQLRTHNIMHPDPFSFKGIREYSPHDPLKAINFKASAKAQELMVNLWEHTNSRQVILLYNLQKHSRWHSEVLDEYTIKLVASLAEKLVLQNVPTRFITNGISVNDSDTTTHIPEGIGELQLDRILEVLALLDIEKTDVVSFSDILNDTATEYKQEPEYWLISTHHGPELEAAYTELRAQGARTVWILPRSTGILLDVEEITLSREIMEHVILA